MKDCANFRCNLFAKFASVVEEMTHANLLWANNVFNFPTLPLRYRFSFSFKWRKRYASQLGNLHGRRRKECAMRTVVTEGRITKGEDCRGDIEPALDQGDAERKRDRDRERERNRGGLGKCWSAFPKRPVFRRYCAKLLHSVRVIPRLQQHGYSLSSPAAAAAGACRPSDTRVRGRACKRYISRTRDERALRGWSRLRSRTHFPPLPLSPRRRMYPVRCCRLFEVERSTDRGLRYIGHPVRRGRKPGKKRRNDF